MSDTRPLNTGPGSLFNEVRLRLAREGSVKVTGLNASNMAAFRLYVRLLEASMNVNLSVMPMADGTDGRSTSALVEVMD